MPFCGEFSSNKTFWSNPDTCTLIMLLWITCIRLIDVSFSVFPKLGQTIYHDYMKLYIFPASIYMFSVYKFIVQTNTNSYFSKCVQIMSSIIFYSNTGT